MSDLVSVIIPFYKNIKLLEKAILSVLNQTYKNTEIIIVNDNPSIKKIKNLLNIKSKKLKYINNKLNIGAGLSRNKAIKISKGKYIAFLDSDDLWKKNKLRLQLKFMKKKKCSACHTSYYIKNSLDKIISKRYAKNQNYKSLIQSCDIGLSTVMIEKKIIGKFINPFPNIKTKEDYVCWLYIAKMGVTFYGINNFLVFYLRHSGSLSSSTYQKIMDAFKVYYKYQRMNIFKTFYRTLVLSLNYLKKI